MDLISRIRSLGVARAVGVGAARADDPAARILLPADYVRDHVEHAYAITASRAQGLTCDRTHVIGAEQMTREGLYVALTRARDGDDGQPAGLDSLASVMSLPAPGGERATWRVWPGTVDNMRSTARSALRSASGAHPAGGRTRAGCATACSGPAGYALCGR